MNALLLSIRCVVTLCGCSFEAADMEDGTTITITKQDVSDKLGSILKKADLKKFVL